MPTRWTLDTCGCQIEFDPHPTEPNTKIIHRKTLKVCPKHAGLEHTQYHADAVLAHNTLKNIAQGFIAQKLGFPPEQHNHSIRGGYRPDEDPIFIVGHGKSGQELEQLQAHADAQFGDGRVKLIPE